MAIYVILLIGSVAHMKNTPKKKWQRMLINILLPVFIFYLLLVVFVYIFQRSLLYFPDATHTESWQVTRSGLTYFPSESGYRALVSIAQSPASPYKGTVVIFHGNAGRAVDRVEYVKALEPLGYRVVLAEYPAYGGRDGAISEISEARLVADGRETVRTIHQKFGGRLYVWGESLGAGVAAAIATDATLPIDGLVLLTPWDSLPDLAQEKFWFLPAKWMVKDRFDSSKNARIFTGLGKPVCVIIAEKDEVIPPHHGKRLFSAIESEKVDTREWIFPGVGHNNWPSSPHEKWWKEVMEHLEGV
jgi:uncharacterized protein